MRKKYVPVDEMTATFAINDKPVVAEEIRIVVKVNLSEYKSIRIEE
ncbi:MAG: hypothetical protein N3B21_12075 [Clostridia bacterium]|nr:hypothetical protein [Clostridia bacterium]